MKPIAIIESKRWENKKTGQTASLYGSLPYYDDGKDWKVVTVGYTVQNDNGTVGNGRIPFKTLAEAKIKYPNLPVNINQEA